MPTNFPKRRRRRSRQVRCFVQERLRRRDAQIAAKFAERAQVARIAEAEAGIEERLFDLYGLTAEERVLVENDRPRRF